MWKELLIKLAFNALLALSQDGLLRLKEYAARKCDTAPRAEFNLWCAIHDFLETLFYQKVREDAAK